VVQMAKGDGKKGIIKKVASNEKTELRAKRW
jgi:hypothetical protein